VQLSRPNHPPSNPILPKLHRPEHQRPPQLHTGHRNSRSRNSNKKQRGVLTLAGRVSQVPPDAGQLVIVEVQRVDVDIVGAAHVVDVIVQVELANGARLSATFCALDYGAYGGVSDGFQGTSSSLLYHYGLPTIPRIAPLRHRARRPLPRYSGRDGQV